MASLTASAQLVAARRVSMRTQVGGIGLRRPDGAALNTMTECTTLLGCIGRES